MSRLFWTLRTSPPSPAPPPDCQSIEPLLPLYADRLASPDQVRQVEAHLPGCEGCRESLFWMQATHRALASRPVALPPANLHSRIAEAIAASSASPSLRPARLFTLRAAYAAAASLTVVGAILWHSLPHSPVPPLPVYSSVKRVPATAASAPPAVLKAKTVLPHPARIKPHQTLTARVFPAKHVLIPKKTVPVSVIAPPDRVADNAPAHTFVPSPVSVKPAAHSPAVPLDKTASAKVPPVEKRQPVIPDMIAPKIASAPPPVMVHIEPPIVTMQPSPVRTTSVAVQSGGLLAAVKARALAISTAPYGKTALMERQISQGGVDALHELDHEHSGYQPAVYTPSTPSE